jgi:tRNA (cmo5U34)-methyltransferase
MSHFDDADAVTRYAAGALRMVPGLHDLHKMAQILLAEAAGPDAHILVLGAGGGMELAAFAHAHPGWHFTGVDPSAPMLDLAARTLGPHADRATLHQGYIDTAPPGPFDGAACLLTLHFLPRADRLQTLRALHARLKPGARLVTAHHSIPNDQKTLWLTRFAAFAQSNGLDPAQAAQMIPTLATRLPTLSPSEDAALLAEAGFTDIQLFYAAFTFRGWVATRA